MKEFEDFPDYLKTIHNEIFRCKTILKSLLEFARPSGGTFREIDINELIKEVLLLLKHRTARLKHTLELNLNREVPKIYADAGSLRQLLMNLLLNAIYFTPEGGSIFIKTEPDETSQERGLTGCPRRIRLSVSDTGAGIPGDLIDKIFDPFFTTKPVGEGTGLGLTICHRIIEEHGGTIDVESEPGNGATFIITLPSIACREG
jgi:signal transduction histidine kinase